MTRGVKGLPGSFRSMLAACTGLLAAFTRQQNCSYIKEAFMSQTCSTEDESTPMKEHFLWEENSFKKRKKMQRLSSSPTNCHCL